jgi:hypothetical protein
MVGLQPFNVFVSPSQVNLTMPLRLPNNHQRIVELAKPEKDAIFVHGISFLRRFGQDPAFLPSSHVVTQFPTHNSSGKPGVPVPPSTHTEHSSTGWAITTVHKFGIPILRLKNLTRTYNTD